MEFVALTPEQQRARRKRNTMLALAVGGFMLLVFLISIAQMQGGAS
jgi:hypothetical protein